MTWPYGRNNSFGSFSWTVGEGWERERTEQGVEQQERRTSPEIADYRNTTGNVRRATTQLDQSEYTMFISVDMVQVRLNSLDVSPCWRNRR